jgi:hypothetical protein
MATFPSLVPSTRLITTAEDQFQPHLSLNGVYRATLLCGSPRNQQISLGFDALSTSDKDLIISHYDDQQGGFLPFDLPNALLSGVTASDYLTGDYLWRYNSSPQVVDRVITEGSSCALVHDVSLTLISQVSELQFVAGVDQRIGMRLSGGAPTVTLSGAALTITASFTPGAASTS